MHQNPGLRILGSLVLALSAAGALGGQLLPPAGQFQVNTYTTNAQSYPKVAIDGEGAPIIVWQSDDSPGTDGDGDSIQARRWASDGAPLGDELQVNTTTAGNQTQPAVAVDQDGDFVVVWTSPDGYYDEIRGQRYSSDGLAAGGEFQISSIVTADRSRPAVGSDAQGNFVVVWQSSSSSGGDTSGYSVQARRYMSDGTPLGGEFQVNTYTSGAQAGAAVAVEADGDFVVVWNSAESADDDTDQHSIHGQRFDANGSPLGPEFEVNSYTTGKQYAPAVALEPSGEFVVVWQSGGSAGTDNAGDYSVQGQRFASDGIPIGSQFQVNTYTTLNQRGAFVAAAADGFFVVWQSNGSAGTDTSGTSTHAQWFDSSATAQGSELQVNTYTTSNQPATSVASGGDVFIVAWTSVGSPGSDTSSTSAQARSYVRPIFADGFESGMTSAWSAVVP